MEVINYRSATYQPQSYRDMDNWLNSFKRQQWLPLLMLYATEGFTGVTQYLRTKYASNLVKWRDKDLQHFFEARKWSDFKRCAER